MEEKSENGPDNKVSSQKCKIVTIEHLTLDGVYQGPGLPDEDTRGDFKHGGWSQKGNDPQMQEIIGKYTSSGWSLLAGKTTYEQFYAYWPNQPKPNPMDEALTNAQKFVASHDPDIELPWKNSNLLTGDISEAVSELKKEHDKTLVIFGSGVLVRSLMEANLIDEYVLMIHPLVLGQGFRLFTDDNPCTQLKLISSVSTNSGVIIATFQHEESFTNK